jgi:1-acyl-sn-glycerol-3-phosphate acyltransferase
VDGAELDGPPASPTVTPRLVVANHRSTIDILLMLHLFGGQLLARGDMATWPGIGVMARRAGTLFVRRDDPASGAGAVQRMRERLRRGITIGVFPEGTTFHGDEVREFQPGAFVAIARERGIVLPVGIAYERDDAIYGDEPIVDHLKRLAQAHHQPNVRILLDEFRDRLSRVVCGDRIRLLQLRRKAVLFRERLGIGISLLR